MKKNVRMLLVVFIVGCVNHLLISLTPCNRDEVVLNTDNSSLYEKVVVGNDEFEVGYAARPDMFAGQKAIVLTCMDPRLNDITAIMGLALEDVYVIRNAGGLATEDMMRSLIISYKLLGAEQIFVVQHTDCGMQKFTNAVMNDLLAESLVTATLVKNCNVTLNPLQSNNVCQWANTSSCCGANFCNGCGCVMNWLAITNGLPRSVLETVRTIRNNSLIPSDIPIYGFIFDVTTGDLIPVPRADEAGRAKPLYCR